MAVYAIGDLHGRFDLLCRALSLAEDHAGEAGGTFIVLGDFVDRGPDSRAIIDLLMQGPSLPNWRWIVLKGNHEDIMWQVINGFAPLRWWLRNGGGATLQSYGYREGDLLRPSKIPQGHIDWLAALPVYHLTETHAFVHAGFDPERPIEEQDDEHMMWKYDPTEGDYSFEGRHVVCGHVQHADGPICTPNRTNLDTFAWLHGRAAVGVFDGAGGPVEWLWAVGSAA